MGQGRIKASFARNVVDHGPLLMFENLTRVIVGAAAVIAVVPGAGLLLGGLELPVEFNELLGLMAAIVGPLVFLVVYLARPWFMKRRRSLLITAVTVLGIAGLAIGFAANTYTSVHKGEYRYMEAGTEKVELYMIPDSMSDPLQRRIGREGGNITNAIMREKSTLTMLNEEAWPVRAKATALFLLAQLMLITAFLTAAWAVAAMAAKDKQ